MPGMWQPSRLSFIHPQNTQVHSLADSFSICTGILLPDFANLLGKLGCKVSSQWTIENSNS